MAMPEMSRMSRLECPLCQRREWYADLAKIGRNVGCVGADYAMLARMHYVEAHQPDVCGMCREPFTRLGDPKDGWSRLCFGCLIGRS